MTRYKEALRWLYGLESRGIKLGLDRMAAAASMRGHPERGLRYVHIAGTNGKGSVATMVGSLATSRRAVSRCTWGSVTLREG